MSEDIPQFVDLLIVFVLLGTNALFSAAQSAAIGASTAKLKAPEERERRGTSAGIWLIGKLDLVISATQLGMSISTLLLGWFGIQAFASAFTRTIRYFDLTISADGSQVAAVILSLVLTALLHVVFGELIAKSLAIRYPEQTLRLLSAAVLAFAQFFRPVVFVITNMTNLFLRFFRTSIPTKCERPASVSELSLLVSQSREEGVFDKDEETMLRGIFGFSDTIAREIMTPRTDLVAISRNASFDEVMSCVAETGLSRFPVKGEEIDNIVGLLLVKDLFRFIPQRPGEAVQGFSVAGLMREPFFIPGTKPIDELLNEFKRRKVHMAVVLDEHGGVDGVVTLEDVIEEIVGDIYDESDEPAHDLVVEENGDVIVDGGMLVADLNDRFSFAIPEGDYDTIAGFIFTSLGRMTKVGDQIVISTSGAVHTNGADAALNPAEITAEGAQDAAESGNGRADHDEANADLPKSVITVEKVESNRIEMVRLKNLLPVQIIEPPAETEASEG